MRHNPFSLQVRPLPQPYMIDLWNDESEAREYGRVGVLYSNAYDMCNLLNREYGVPAGHPSGADGPLPDVVDDIEEIDEDEGDAGGGGLPSGIGILIDPIEEGDYGQEDIPLPSGIGIVEDIDDVDGGRRRRKSNRRRSSRNRRRSNTKRRSNKKRSTRRRRK